jgi:hypothetical protein
VNDVASNTAGATTWRGVIRRETGQNLDMSQDESTGGALMDDAELEAVIARCASATAGPWESFVEGRDHVAGDSFIRRGGLDDSVDDMYITPWRLEDQDFIAAARQDVPRLVREVRRLREQLNRTYANKAWWAVVSVTRTPSPWSDLRSLFDCARQSSLLAESLDPLHQALHSFPRLFATT